jgi:hypothetical protein
MKFKIIYVYKLVNYKSKITIQAGLTKSYLIKIRTDGRCAILIKATIAIICDLIAIIHVNALHTVVCTIITRRRIQYNRLIITSCSRIALQT